MKTFPNGHAIFSELALDEATLAAEFSLFVAGLATAPTSGLSIAVHSELEPADVVKSSLELKSHHIVQKNSERFESEIKAGLQLMQNYAAYFDEHYQLYPPANKEEVACSTVRIDFLGKQDKAVMKDNVRSFVERFANESILQTVESLIEELYMNAVIDAPREAERRGYPSCTKPNQIFLARTKMNLQVSCTDFCGSLDLKNLMDRMHDVYTRGAGQAINLASGSGAGLGCVILLENCVSLYFGVHPGIMTKVTCVVPLGVSSRQREKMRKSLHWFSL